MVRIVFAMVFLLSSGAAAEPLDVFGAHQMNPDGSPAGFELKVKAGVPQLIKAIDGSTPALCLDSANSSFWIQRSIDLDIKKYPLITWRWRADILPPRGDFRSSKTDDQAAQMVVAFGSRYAIDYIWDTNAPVDSIGEYYVPLIVTAKILVVANKQNKLQEWAEVTRNLREDYRRLFGEEPGNISGVRFQVNSQHTESHAEGCISRITFHN
jgi:hypothetical protein